MPYLAFRSGTYFLRVAVPKSLQSLLGQAEIFQNLKTNQREEARILALSLSAELFLKFAEWKRDLKNKSTIDGIERIGRFTKTPDGEIHFLDSGVGAPQPAPEINAGKFELGELSNGQPYIKKTDGPEDYQNAKEALQMAQEAARIPIAANPQPISQNVIEPSITAKAARDEAASLTEKLAGIKPRNIHSAFNDYLTEIKGSTPRSFSQYKSHIKHFVDWITQQHPNISVHKVSKDHIREYRELLRVSKSHRAPFEIFHPHNVYKRMVVIEGFFRYCQKGEWIADGDKKIPTYGLKGKKPDYENSETSYVMFSHIELEKIFSPETYQANFEAPHMFWGPLLGLFTGARLAEIVKLQPTVDITNTTNNSKTWTLNITHSVKNKNSRRTIPLHSDLIELGLLEYLEDLNKIFPEATSMFPYTWNMQKIFGEAFAKHCDRVGVISPLKVFHSFRKNVANVLLNAGVIDYKYQEHYIGHLKYTLHQTIYSGIEFPMKFYSDIINKHLKYDLDLSPFKYQRGMFDDFLLDQKRKQDHKKKFANKNKKVKA